MAIKTPDDKERTATEDTEPNDLYTYHHEPPSAGGKRYVRCTECGAECVPAVSERMYHLADCPEADR